MLIGAKQYSVCPKRHRPGTKGYLVRVDQAVFFYGRDCDDPALQKGLGERTLRLSAVLGRPM